MIEIIKKGTEKKFYDECIYCRTEFSYMFEDTEPCDDGTLRQITCPVCGKTYIATFSGSPDMVGGMLLSSHPCETVPTIEVPL